MDKSKVHPDFDGHLKKEIKDMTPDEKLFYLSQQILYRGNSYVNLLLLLINIIITAVFKKFISGSIL